MEASLTSLLAALALSTNANTIIRAPMKALSHTLNPIPEVTEMIPRKHINLLTYNFFLRPPTVQDDQYDDYKDQRVEEFLKHLPEYDIICFEEVFGIMNMRKNNLIEFGKQAGFLYHTDSPGPSPNSGCLVDGGLLILSRFPILACDFQAFPKGYQLDGFVEKGVLYAKLQVKDDILHLFHTHQFTDYEGYILSMIKRAEGFVCWREFMKNCLHKHNYRKDELCLLLGDFNVDGRDPLMTPHELAEHPALKLYPDLAKKQKIGEYDAMYCILTGNDDDELDDLTLKKFNKHPFTFSSIYGGSSSLALDYIFEFTPKGILKGLEEQKIEKVQREGRLKVLPETLTIEKFEVQGHAFKQLSDHYGLVVSLEYSEKDSQ